MLLSLYLFIHFVFIKKKREKKISLSTTNTYNRLTYTKKTNIQHSLVTIFRAEKMPHALVINWRSLCWQFYVYKFYDDNHQYLSEYSRCFLFQFYLGFAIISELHVHRVIFYTVAATQCLTTRIIIGFKVYTYLLLKDHTKAIPTLLYTIISGIHLDTLKKILIIEHTKHSILASNFTEQISCIFIPSFNLNGMKKFSLQNG